jgi:isoamylase
MLPAMGARASLGALEGSATPLRELAGHSRCVPDRRQREPSRPLPPRPRLIAARASLIRRPIRGSRSRRALPPRAVSASPAPPPPPAAAAAPADAARLASPADPSEPGAPPHPVAGAVLRGAPEPLGATLDPCSGAVNFAVYSGNAWAVSLCLFTEADLLAGRVTAEVPLPAARHRTGDVWHAALAGAAPGLLYGWRLDGPRDAVGDGFDPAAAGHGFDPRRVLLDPYARAVFNGRRRFGELGPELPYGAPGVLGLARTWPQAAAPVPEPAPPFDWEGDRPLGRPAEELVVYEAHVRGFTAAPSSGAAAPGTFAALTEKLDYLADLGVTALELLPVHEFNELEYYSDGPAVPPRYNYWGYSTVAFFAPMARFSAAATAAGPGASPAAAAAAALDEFKSLVKAAHARGIEVILDVVFNHTAEGSEAGPTLSFRGLDNRAYYMLAPGGECYNYSGCGNTFNCNHPAARALILDSLRYWVEECHVDGFRFDLGSVLTRAHSTWHRQEAPPGAEAAAAAAAAADGGDADDAAAAELAELAPAGAAPLAGGAVVNEAGHMTDGAGVPTGTPLPDPPLIAAISADPVLANTKLIAEAWDCDGLNQVGAFPHYGGRWAEWNGHFRDAVRQFIKGTDGPWAGSMAAALVGSPNVFVNEPGGEDWWGSHGGRRWKGGRGPAASVNFVTAHDGFTLADLVSYNEKDNGANGEDNRDGEAHNLSWNCGAEGPSADAGVAALRARQARNMLAALLLSNGVPMLHMGDEYGHSKRGNNNTYCHDSELNWLDWAAARADAGGLRRFTRALLALRAARPALRRAAYVGEGDVTWHGVDPDEPDWTDASRFLAFSLPEDAAGGGLYAAFNASHLPAVPRLPAREGRAWVPLVDTGKAAPYDVLVADERLPAEEAAAARAALEGWTLEGAYPMLPWSCIVLESAPREGRPAMPAARRAAAAPWEVSGGGGGAAEAAATAKRRAGKPRRAKADAPSGGEED